jgi:hypothetical protein
MGIPEHTTLGGAPDAEALRPAQRRARPLSLAKWLLIVFAFGGSIIYAARMSPALIDCLEKHQPALSSGVDPAFEIDTTGDEVDGEWVSAEIDLTTPPAGSDLLAAPQTWRITEFVDKACKEGTDRLKRAYLKHSGTKELSVCQSVKRLPMTPLLPKFITWEASGFKLCTSSKPGCERFPDAVKKIFKDSDTGCRSVEPQIMSYIVVANGKKCPWE